jgi:hypothetical protein
MVRKLPEPPIDNKDGQSHRDQQLARNAPIETDRMRVEMDWSATVFTCLDCHWNGKVLDDLDTYVMAQHVAGTGHTIKGMYRHEFTMRPK